MLDRSRIGGVASFTSVLALSLSLSVAHALSYVPLSPHEIAAVSSDVVIATAVAVHDEVRADGSLVQRVDLAVLERWKGTPARHMTRTQVVLMADADAPGRPPRSVAGNVLLEVGRTYLMFLREPADLPRLPLTTAGEAGLYRAERHGGSWRFTTLDGREVIGVTRDRWRHRSVSPTADADVVPLRGSVARPRPDAARVVAPGAVAIAWRALVVETER